MDQGAQLLIVMAVLVVGIVLVGGRIRRTSATAAEPMSDGQRTGVIVGSLIVGVVVMLVLLMVEGNTSRMLG